MALTCKLKNVMMMELKMPPSKYYCPIRVDVEVVGILMLEVRERDNWMLIRIYFPSTVANFIYITLFINNHPQHFNRLLQFIMNF